MKEIKCKCGKLIAKQRDDGKIYVWCKECRKEVELNVEHCDSIGINKKEYDKNEK